MRPYEIKHFFIAKLAKKSRYCGECYKRIQKTIQHVIICHRFPLSRIRGAYSGEDSHLSDIPLMNDAQREKAVVQAINTLGNLGVSCHKICHETPKNSC